MGLCLLKKGLGGPLMDFFGTTAGNQIYLIYAVLKFPPRIQNPNPAARLSLECKAVGRDL